MQLASLSFCMYVKTGYYIKPILLKLALHLHLATITVLAHAPSPLIDNISLLTYKTRPRYDL